MSGNRNDHSRADAGIVFLILCVLVCIIALSALGQFR